MYIYNTNISQDKSKTYTSAFTIIELIVAITVMVILIAIGIFSLLGYGEQARDSGRISDLTTINTLLESYKTDFGNYPLPHIPVKITYNGGLVWNQGIFPDTKFTNHDYSLDILKDPLTKSYYSYSLMSNGNEFEVAGILEDLDYKMNNFNLLNDSRTLKADAGNMEAIAIVMGNYNGEMVISMNGTNCNVITIPSITSNNTDVDTNLENIIKNERLVYSGFKNLPSSYKGSIFKTDGGFPFFPNNLLAYSDESNCKSLSSLKNYSARLKLLEGIEKSYSGTILKGKGKISKILELNLIENSENIEEETPEIVGSGTKLSPYLYHDVPFSCNDIKVNKKYYFESNNINLIDGYYTINIGNGDIDVYCDMTTDGGGRTRVFYSNSDSVSESLIEDKDWNTGPGINFSILWSMRNLKNSDGLYEFMVRDSSDIGRYHTFVQTNAYNEDPLGNNFTQKTGNIAFSGSTINSKWFGLGLGKYGNEFMQKYCTLASVSDGKMWNYCIQDKLQGYHNTGPWYNEGGYDTNSRKWIEIYQK